MKVAISTTGENLEAALDPRLGRAARFIVYSLGRDTYEVLDNSQNLNAPQGAGIQAAQHLIHSGAKGVITGHCGPKAFRVLSAEGIAVYHCQAQTVKEALEQFRNGQLKLLHDADVEGHWV